MSDPLHPAPEPSAGEPLPNDGWTTTPSTDPTDRVGFCQDCGKPLTAQTVRTVGTGVFCEPCLTARVAAPNPAVYAGVPPVGAIPVVPVPVFGEASPVLAGFLGLIPGVGAMYNGQYAKGFAHLIIFVLLDSLQKNVSNIFGVFVVAWIFYQVFDAYHTAKARNEGQPLPNVFGLNDIGERMGFHKARGVSGQPAAAPGAPVPPPVSGWETPPSAPGPVPSGPDWVGYVPPTHFAGAVPVVAPESYAAAVQQQPYGAGFVAPPHTSTFTGAGIPNPYAVPPIPPVGSDWATQPIPVPEPPIAHKRFPAGALWLIGLGLLILLANLLPDWKITERWWPPIVFAALAVWIFLRRINSGARLLSILRAPVILMALAIMFALHAADIYINFGMVCAVTFIVLGALLLLERTIGIPTAYVPVQTPRVSFVPAPDPVAPPHITSHDDDGMKGGQ